MLLRFVYGFIACFRATSTNQERTPLSSTYYVRIARDSTRLPTALHTPHVPVHEVQRVSSVTATQRHQLHVNAILVMVIGTRARGALHNSWYIAFN